MGQFLIESRIRLVCFSTLVTWQTIDSPTLENYREFTGMKTCRFFYITDLHRSLTFLLSLLHLPFVYNTPFHTTTLLAQLPGIRNY